MLHFHKWIASSNGLYLRTARLNAEVAIQAPSLVSELQENLQKGVGIAETRVLYRCSRDGCTALKVKTLLGWWSMESITGQKTGEEKHGDT